MANRFSKRFGHKQSDVEITVREDAPKALREFLVQLVYDLKYEPSFLRTVICRILRVAPDRDNWSEFPNIDYEVNQLIQECDWYYVYDIIEYLWDEIDSRHREEFQEELNDYFRSNGIGWKIEYGQIQIRGNENFETTIVTVEKVLNEAKLQTAKSEIKEALNDLSRRPEPDITGAIQHSLACLECVCREVAGDKKATLGELMKKYSGIIPKPLDVAIEKIWGFTSEQGRHLSEGKKPEFLEAELVVELSAAISSYLGKKIVNMKGDEEDLPF